MSRFNGVIEEPNLFAKALFLVGGVLTGLAFLFYVFILDRVTLAYEIQMPFGLLFVLLMGIIIMVLVFILITLYNLLKGQEQVGYFTPVTRTLIILMLLSLIVSIQFIGDLVYLMVRVVP